MSILPYLPGHGSDWKPLTAVTTRLPNNSPSKTTLTVEAATSRCPNLDHGMYEIVGLGIERQR